jgi:hypothetical protein
MDTRLFSLTGGTLGGTAKLVWVPTRNTSRVGALDRARSDTFRRIMEDTLKLRLGVPPGVRSSRLNAPHTLVDFLSYRHKAGLSIHFVWSGLVRGCLGRYTNDKDKNKV